MMTSLHLTDVVVLREGDTVNSLGLGMTKTSRCFEVTAGLMDPSLSLYALENPKATATPGQRSTAKKLSLATPSNAQ